MRPCERSVLALLQARLTIVLVALAAVAFFMLATPKPALAKNWYVSSRISARTHDGTSWKTPWSNSSKIVWANVAPGDIIFFDAGPTVDVAVTYDALRVQVNQVDISVAVDHGYSAGTVLFAGPGVRAGTTGIDCGSYTCNILGTQWTANPYFKRAPNIRIQNFATGINVGLNNGQFGVTASGVRVQNCRVGVNVWGNFWGLYSLLHDNTISMLVAAPGNVTLDDVWMCNYNTTADAGLITTGISTQSSVIANECVWGPGLSIAATLNSPSITFSDNYSLYLDPRTTNWNLLQAPFSTQGGFDVQYCTSFLPAVNQLGQSHSILTFTEPANLNPGQTQNVVIDNSIFYGGVMNVAGNTFLGGYGFDYIYRVSGNTTDLAAASTNPLFVSNPSSVYSNGVYGIWNPLFNKLCSLNFALQPSSPCLDPNGVAAGADPVTSSVWGRTGFVANMP
jgi:hypothetical protein